MAKILKNNANKLLADFCKKYSKCSDIHRNRFTAIEMCKTSETKVTLRRYGIVDLAMLTLVFNDKKNKTYIAQTLSVPNFLN